MPMNSKKVIRLKGWHVSVPVLLAALLLLSISSLQASPLSRATPVTAATDLSNAGSELVSHSESDSITPGKLVFHKANNKIAYNWFSYVPTSLDKSKPAYIWLTGLHGNLVTDDYGAITKETRIQAQWRLNLAEQNQYALIAPAIPRPATIPVYVVAFDWQVFVDSTDPFLRRPDEKINLMIDRLQAQLRQAGYQARRKVFIDGFSAGGMFAQRYALLHPDRVKAVAAGQCGGVMTLGAKTYGAFEMQWPIGTYDFSELVGGKFNRRGYKQLPQFIYIGDQDTQNSMLPIEVGFFRGQANVDFLMNTFGKTDPVRLENQVKYLNNKGYNRIVFKKYIGVGHQITGEMIQDAMDFFKAHQ